MEPKASHITEESIKTLVDTFYNKVQKDEALGPIFNGVIQDWPPHLQRMYAFWSSVVLQTGRYKGNPVSKHADIMPFDRELFSRWLALFAETASEVFEEDQAQVFVEKSENIARSLQYMLYEFPSAGGRPGRPQ